MTNDGELRPLFRRHLPEFDWQSIETGLTGGGVPDSNFCRSGVEGWVEHKQTAGWVCSLRPEQVGWIMRRVRNGGRVWVAVRRRAPEGPRRASADELWVVHGRYAVEAKAGGLRAVEPHAQVWHNGPGAWDWRAIGKLLVS